MNAISNVLQNYTQDRPDASSEDVERHYDQVAQAAPPSDLASGLSGMFRSDSTAPFGQLISQLFSQSNGNQRADILNTLLASGAASGLLAQLARSAGINLGAAGNGGQVTPEEAARVSPEIVEQVAAQAEKQDPSIIERASQFYAQHPMLVKSLGAVAMSMFMSHIANRRR